MIYTPPIQQSDWSECYNHGTIKINNIPAVGSSSSKIVTSDTFGLRITCEGGGSSANGSNLNSNEKLSASSMELSSMIVTSNECWRFASSKVRNTSRFSALISW